MTMMRIRGEGFDGERDGGDWLTVGLVGGDWTGGW